MHEAAEVVVAGNWTGRVKGKNLPVRILPAPRGPSPSERVAAAGPTSSPERWRRYGAATGPGGEHPQGIARRGRRTARPRST